MTNNYPSLFGAVLADESFVNTVDSQQQSHLGDASFVACTSTNNFLGSSLIQNYNKNSNNRNQHQSTVSQFGVGLGLGGQGQDYSLTNSQTSRGFVQANPDGLYSVNASTAHMMSVSAFSNVEAAILRSSVPIDINGQEEIEVNGQRGILANGEEILNWKGDLPITQYAINQDDSPEIINKQTNQKLQYVQELAIRYLRPPTPPTPGEIVIKQEPNILTPPGPSIVLRQQPPRPVTPEPLVIRESPPQPPPQVGRKVITISGKRIPPPPRKVVIERLAPLPSKPQSVLIERWLPYNQTKRRVIYQRSAQPDPVVVKPRNIIVQWETPKLTIRREYKYLGIIRANPSDYVSRYGPSLKSASDMPDFVNEIKPPKGLVLAAEQPQNANNVHELYGDVQALKLIDLEREGLAQYRDQIQSWNVATTATTKPWTNSATASVTTVISQQPTQSMFNISYSPYQPQPQSQSQYIIESQHQQQQSYATYVTAASANNLSTVSSTSTTAFEDAFNTVYIDSNGKLQMEDAIKVLVKLSERLNRGYSADNIRMFLQALDTRQEGYINYNDLKRYLVATGF